MNRFESDAGRAVDCDIVHGLAKMINGLRAQRQEYIAVGFAALNAEQESRRLVDAALSGLLGKEVRGVDKLQHRADIYAQYRHAQIPLIDERFTSEEHCLTAISTHTAQHAEHGYCHTD